MQKWEYLRLDIAYSVDMARMTTNLDPARTIDIKAFELINSLDNLGSQNWEMVSMSRSGEREIFYFKRRVE